MQPNPPNLKDSLNSLKKSIDSLGTELKTSKEKKELSYGTQRHSSFATIAGFYVSIALTVGIFWYTSRTDTNIKGMSDLLHKQDTANYKQDSSLRKQDSMILSFKDNLTVLTKLLDSTTYQNTLISKQLSSLNNLVIESNSSNKIGQRQYDRLTDVLKGIENSYFVLNMSFLADKRRSYFSLLDSVTKWREYDTLLRITYAMTRMQHSNSNGIGPGQIGPADVITQKLAGIQSNAYLFYDSLAQTKFLKLFGAGTVLKNDMQVLYSSPSPKTQEEYQMIEYTKTQTRLRSWGDFVSFSQAYFDFKDYILSGDRVKQISK